LEGIRAQESDARAEKEPFTLRTSITGKRYRDTPFCQVWSLYQEDREKALRYQHISSRHLRYILWGYWLASRFTALGKDHCTLSQTRRILLILTFIESAQEAL
jgi:hypothetical protein